MGTPKATRPRCSGLAARSPTGHQPTQRTRARAAAPHPAQWQACPLPHQRLKATAYESNFFFSCFFLARQFSSQLCVPSRLELLRASCGRLLRRAAAGGLRPPGTRGVRPPTHQPAAAPPRHTRLPCPTAAQGVTGREPAARRQPTCLSSGDLPPVAAARSHGGAARALEVATRRRKSAISAPKRPPTSTASTTRRPGYVVWRFRRAASAAALPGTRSAPARAAPVPAYEVVSTAA